MMSSAAILRVAAQIPAAAMISRSPTERMDNSKSTGFAPVKSLCRNRPASWAHTMEERLARALLRRRFYTTVALCFAGFAVTLAVIGVYGVVSYAVSQRAQEMGIRMALGTTAAKLRGTVLWQGLLPVALGSFPGLQRWESTACSPIASLRGPVKSASGWR